METDDDYVVRADLPGLSDSDVNLEVADGTLTLSGERVTRTEEELHGYRRVERANGSFRRSLSLPEGVEPASVTASLDRGVLEIRIPKPAVRTPHAVSITAGPVASGN